MTTGTCCEVGCACGCGTDALGWGILCWPLVTVVIFPVVVLAEVILPALAASYILKLCPHVVANCAWGVREDVVADIMVGTVPKA